MTMTGRSIIGVFDEPAMADRAIDALQNAGFSGDQIYHSRQHASGGGFLAGIKHLFSGDDSPSENVGHDLADMGVSENQAHYYENEAQAGHEVVAVRANGREQEAMDILNTNGAYNYEMRHGNVQAGSTSPVNTTRTTGAKAPHTNEYAPTTDEHVLKLREEQLSVNKQQAQTGEVQLGKNVVSEQKTVNVPVTHEEAYLERRPATDAMTNNTTPIGEGETIRVPMSEEKVNVSKDNVVTGEVSLDKRAVQGTQKVTDTVKREEAHVEQQGDAPIHGTQSDYFHPESVNKDTP